MNEKDTSLEFAGRRPSFNFTRGGPVLRGFRSRPGAPQAQPPSGLTSGSNAMSDSAWVDTFKGNAAPQTRLNAAIKSGEFNGVSDISRSTLDAVFGDGFWNRLMDRGPMVQYAPRESLSTPKPFMPRGPNEPFTVPSPVTSPMGNRQSDAANMAANRSMFSPGGAQGFWGRRVGSQPPQRASVWQAPTIADAAAIETRYRRV